MKIAILDDYFDTLKSLPCFSKLKNHDVTVWNDKTCQINVLAERLKDTEALVLFRERTKITAELLDRLPNLKLISQRSVYPHVDVEACTKNNILFCSKMQGGSPPYATIEHVWALILSSARQIPKQMHSLQNGNWQMGVGKTLHGKTLGLYGYGRIAKGVEQIANAFGMNVVWWASDTGRERLKADNKNVTKTREDFFSSSHVISVHVRMKPETTGIITADDFSNMSKDALFVNTSRAGLIANGALIDGLNNGRPSFAAIDVFDEEPTPKDDPITCHPNVVATPHIGFVTEDEFENQFSDIFDQITAYYEGEPIHMINPQVWNKNAPQK
ncbi:MAG: D-2-hydroxyacid dehydrogenase family protein [Rhizobiales bacterium]|nr:D-2-hydroxyacid dehydrogenase family protein [Hyphomicrobiales bacterium]